MTITALTKNVEMATVLKKIVADKVTWLTSMQQQNPLTCFKDQIIPSDRNFYHSLSQKQPAFILECKKASPSKGLIRQDFDPVAIANIYKEYATVISVLTDEKYFQGSFDFLPLIRSQVKQPILCKDFIIDEYQIYLARYHQADAILLMLSILSDEEYRHLSHIAHQLNMGILTEASTDDEVKRAIQLDAKVIGINNRDLRDLSVDLNRVKQLSKQIPKGKIVISESGIHTHEQLIDLTQFANGFLIGSALMSEENLNMAIRKLLYGENKICGLTRAIDANWVYEAGAVYGGLIFVTSSPRYIRPENAITLVKSAPLNWVGVFSNESLTKVCEIATELNLYAVQLHGEEDNIYIENLRQLLPKHCQIWQALSIKDYVPTHDNPLIDRYIFDNKKGGSGQCFDWSLLKGCDLSKVILAGGLNAENIQLAKTTGAVGFDFNSGVEISPGIKDKQKIHAAFGQIISKQINK